MSERTGHKRLFRWITRPVVVLLVFLLGGLAGFGGYRYWSGPTDDVAYLTLLIDSGYYDEAIGAIKRSIDSGRLGDRAVLLLARAYGAKGDLRRCAEVLSTMPAESPYKSEALLRQGQALMQRHDAMGAEAALLGCIRRPQTARGLGIQARSELAKIYGIEDRQHELRQLLWETYQLASPTAKPAILQRLLNLEFFRTEPNLRIEKLQPFVDGNSRDVLARVALGRALLEGNQVEKGLGVISEALQIEPDNADVWRAWLRGLFAKGDLDKLAEELPRCPDEVKSDSSYWRLKAIVSQQHGDWEHAAAAYAKAIQIAPETVDLHSQYAVALTRLGRKEEAQQHVRRAQVLREGRNELQKALEDWTAGTHGGKSPAELIAIVERIIASARRAELTGLADAWTLTLKEMQRQAPAVGS